MFIHLYLDYMNKHPININPVNFIKYFLLPNNSNVEEKYLALKGTGNFLHRVFVYTFLLAIILLIIWNLTNPNPITRFNQADN